MTNETPTETSTLDYDAEPEDDWLDEGEELPSRPRRKLLSPLPLTLLVVLLIACAFFGGVEVEKGNTSSGGSAGLGSGLAAVRSRLAGAGRSRTGAAGTSTSGFPGAGGSFAGAGAGGLAGAGLTTGEVSFASGDTLYVTSSEGNTVKVSAPQGTKVTKTVTTTVDDVHPGDTVVVRGTQNKNGSISASSIAVSSSAGSSTGTAGSTTAGAGATQQLFGAG
jgi:hypothetical protein